MISRLIELALKFRVAVIACVLALAGAGIWAFATIGFDAFPDLTPNQVLVMTGAPGMSPEEIENLVSYPLETALLGLPRTQSVRSVSKAGVSIVTVTFDDGVDFYFARAQVQQRTIDAAMSLPNGLQPMLGPPATSMGEVFEYLVESDTRTPIELWNLQEYVIKPRLRTIAGVADINTWGGMVQQYQVHVDPVKLSAYTLTLMDVQRAVAGNNDNFGAGYVEANGDRLRVRGLGRVVSEADIANIVVTTRAGGTPIYVRDVASVAIGAMPREGAVTRDGRGEALSATVVMLKGSNGRDVVSRVLTQLDAITPLLPKDVHVRPFYSQKDVVDNTTHTVFTNLLEGGLLVMLILFLFLGNVRASVVVASVIPLALMFAFVAMKTTHVSVNLMSLGALDFGLIVDASVVMVENFVRRLQLAEPTHVTDRRPLFRAAAYEVGRPIVFGVCIIIAVYVPIFSLQGLEGRMFRPMAFTVCTAVLGSLLLALTYIPAVSSYLLGSAREVRVRWFEGVRAWYARALTAAQSHRRGVIATSAAALVVALVSVAFIGTEFMPKLDEGSLLIESRRIPSTAIHEGIGISQDVERTLLKFPEVKSVVTNLGRPELAVESMGLYQADVYVLFNPKRTWKVKSNDALIAEMDSALSQIPGLDYDFSAPMAMRLDELISGVRTQLGIKIFGDSLPLLRQTADDIKAIVDSVRGAEDVSIRVSAGAMRVDLEFDRLALARYGLNISDVREFVQTGVGGETASEVIDGRRRYPIVVRLAESYRSTPDAIGRLLITTPSGARIALSQVARVRTVEGSEAIDHEGGQRLVVVQSNVRGRDLGSFAAEVRGAVERKISLPPGYFITYGGQFENQQRAMKRLAIIVPLVLLMILGFLQAAFGATRHALLVMLNVPFAFVGGIAALWGRGLNLSLSASIGFIALFGVAVLNGVVLITCINDLRAHGLNVRDAVRAGTDTRLRPVLMTALVAGVGFLPMALSTSQGAEIQRPLATVVIGGLISSTILTLIVLPLMYELVEERLKR